MNSKHICLKRRKKKKYLPVKRNFKLPTANADDKGWINLSGQYEILFEQISSSVAV